MRESIYKAAVSIGSLEGEDAISRQRVAAKLGLPVTSVEAEFASDSDLAGTVEDYLKERKAGYIAATFDGSPQVDSALKRVMALGQSYFAYILDDPEKYHFLFELHGGLSSEQIQAAMRGEPVGNESFQITMDELKTLGREGRADGSPPPPADLCLGALSAWATVHGMAHLSLVGVLRHQHTVVRRYNFDTVLEHYILSLAKKFAGGGFSTPPGLYEELRPVIEAYSASRTPVSWTDLPEDANEQQLAAAAMEATIEVAGTEGPRAISVERLSEMLGRSQEDVLGIIESEFALREHAEEITDAEVFLYFAEVMKALPEDTSPMDRLRAMAVAYFDYAMAAPTRFNAMIALGSKSVVPAGAATDNMGTAFRALQELCALAIEASGVEPKEQLVYIKTLTLWAGANGVAHLCALGDLRGLSLDEKWTLMAEVIENVIDTFTMDLVKQ